eukprot:TRINITY_DN369_c0_g1_i1.p1 TRINITY_DN369_c0_g1~~TRINITY_DN369_c0_g1_i1.p1  ORF type:complete len:177 (-),score=55.99 TRINITY_DN369_c0_g1_i1:150-680(-)
MASVSSNSFVDLFESIELSQVQILNGTPESHPEGVFKRVHNNTYVKSDADAELLITIPFKSAVKIASISFRATVAHPSLADASGPKNVKLFVNNANIGFAEAADEPAVQEFDLKPAHLDGSPLELRFVKFQNVHTLTVFVASNQQDSPSTYLSQIALSGQSIQGMNVSEIKAVEDD